MAGPWTFVTVLLLACLTMPTTPLPVTSQADPETGQSTLMEELGKVSSEIDTMSAMMPRLKDTLRQLTARLDAQEDFKSQGAAIKALAQDIQEQGQAIKVQGQDIKTQGQEAKRITNDLKIHGTQMRDLVDAFDELNTEFRDLRKGIVHRIESQDKKIEWSITDGSLAPRNTSWVEENFHTLMKYMNEQKKELNELHIKIDDLTSLVIITDCSDAPRSDVYPTFIPGLKIKTYCQVDNTGSWTVIQRRQDGSVNFTRSWKDYRQGFGDVSAEHWLGNDHIHALTAHGLTKLRIDLHDWDNTMHTLYYNTFQVAGAEAKYALTVSGFGGSTPPGDSFVSHNRAKFSTYDQDNDVNGGNCALKYKGGWWYIAGCHQANLNGAYNNSNNGEGINWKHWKGYRHSLKRTIMMIAKP